MVQNRHYSAEREQLAKAYPGRKWAEKVLKMSDAQVHATWIDILKRKEKKNKGG